MTAPARFKQDDVARAVAGAIKGGMSIGSMEIDPNGVIRIMPAGAHNASKPNPLDRLLKPKNDA